MITSLVVNALLGALDALFGLLPSFTITPPGNSGEFALIGGLQRIFPINDLVTIVELVIVVLLGLRLWDFGVFVYHQFWGSS